MENFQRQFVLALLAYAAKRNIDLRSVCQISGINDQALTRDVRITAQQMEGLWRNLSHLSHDSLFGLHFGESMQLAALGVVGQIVQTSNNVSEALTNAGALIGLITDQFSMHLEHGKKSFVIHLLNDPKKAEAFPFTFRHMADYLMAFIVHELDGLLLKKIQPLSVGFPYPIKESYEYARVFRCPVHQNQQDFCIELSNRYLSQSIISANYTLQNHLLQKVNGLLKTGNKDGSLQSRIFNYLLTNSYLYAMSLEAVAANFNISPRTLQRKLKEEGVSFLQIVDDVRKKLAIQYLASGNYPVKDVAYILGYNEQSAFIRAFKRWTGCTPLEYVKKQQTAFKALAKT